MFFSYNNNHLFYYLYLSKIYVLKNRVEVLVYILRNEKAYATGLKILHWKMLISLDV